MVKVARTLLLCNLGIKVAKYSASSIYVNIYGKVSHICNLSESVTPAVVLDGLYSNRDLHRVPFRYPETLRTK